MRPVQDTTSPAPAAPRRLARLFKVLVVGGAVLATAYASAIQGPSATAESPDGGSDGGGTQGW